MKKEDKYFFKWLKSINKLDTYKTLLCISKDYTGNEIYRTEAWNRMERLKTRYEQEREKQ